MNRLGAAVKIPSVPVKSEILRSQASQLGRLIWRFNLSVNRALITYREPVMDMQLVQERIAGAAMEMFASACVISRWMRSCKASDKTAMKPGKIVARPSFSFVNHFHRIRRFLNELTDNDDKALLATANSVLGKTSRTDLNGS